MFERLGDRISGRATVVLHNRAARHLSRLVSDLVADAMARWSANGWARFDEQEVNCTGQLYRWLLEATRDTERYGVLSVIAENVQFTPEMLNGTQPVTHAVRPDLRISVNGREGVSVEAKRLRGDGAWCRKYVQEGMARFVSSSYATTEALGIMVGYVQQPSLKGLRERVNGYVRDHQLMGDGHELDHGSAEPHAHRLSSSHTRRSGPTLTLHHLWVVLP